MSRFNVDRTRSLLKFIVGMLTERINIHGNRAKEGRGSRGMGVVGFQLNLANFMSKHNLNAINFDLNPILISNQHAQQFKRERTTRVFQVLPALARDTYVADPQFWHFEV